ncbi:MAG: transcriptional repressor [Candidatus Krumholzibacteria bacterium]|nr:transcriptional repressor [Candidatus Krumholzibacteria bacterium]
MAGCQRRNTRQRQMVLQELRASYVHPTAGEIYQSVRDRLPNISLGTVYRNLDILLETGQAIRLASILGQEARYDGRCEPHVHFQCHECGRIYDLNSAWPALDDLVGKMLEGHAIAGFQLLLHGTCLECSSSNHD